MNRGFWLAGVVLLAACGADPVQNSSEASAAAPRVVTSGLAAPWSIAFVDGAALVSERDSGRVLEILADGSHRAVVELDDVVAAGEGGLLGLAVADRQLYAYSTGPAGNRIQRFELSGEPGALAAGPAHTVIEGLPSARNHNGGRIAFGPDGMLYVGVGDAGDPDSAQDPTALSGKILRLTPDGGIPADNPVPGSPVYSLGHRNVQGLGWLADGSMLATEFGQNTWDELNVIVAGGNYGWPVVEGTGGGSQFVDPVRQWTPDEASPSGMAVDDESILVANLKGEVLRVLPASGDGPAVDRWAGEYGRLRDVAVAPDGSIWVLTNNTDGRGDPGPTDDSILVLPTGP